MIEIVEPVPEDIARAISDGIIQANQALAVERENFVVIHRLGDRLVGGVTASISFSVLFVNNLWVSEDRRRLGMGSALMLAVEDEGRRRGARRACVDTLSSQAPAFYVKLGYQEFGRLTGETAGARIDRIWFHKAI